MCTWLGFLVVGTFVGMGDFNVERLVKGGNAGEKEPEGGGDGGELHVCGWL